MNYKCTHVHIMHNGEKKRKWKRIKTASHLNVERKVGGWVGVMVGRVGG